MENKKFMILVGTSASLEILWNTQYINFHFHYSWLQISNSINMAAINVWLTCN